MDEYKFTLDQSFLNIDSPSYAFNIYNILNAYNDNKDKGIKKAKDFRKNKESFLKAIDNFKNKYDNADEFLDALYEIANSYDENDKKVTSYINSKNMKNNNDERKQILNKVYNSGLSIIDYYFYNNITINGFNQYLNEQGYHGNKLAKEIKSRKDKTIPLIIDIINKINNDEIDYINYFEITKLNPIYLKNIAKENNLYTKKLAKFIGNRKNHEIRINVENELDAKLVINNE